MSVKIDFNAINSPEHDSWKAHRQLLVNTISSDDAGYRGCIGLGLRVDTTDSNSWIGVVNHAGEKTFLPDANARWLSLTDIPLGFFRLTKTREVHWATCRPTTMRYGMPTISRGSEDRMAWDFRAMPHDAVTGTDEQGHETVINSSRDVLRPSKEPQLFRAFNRMEWAMTSTAFMFRGSWKGQRKKLFDIVGEHFDSEKKLLLFGGEKFNECQRPEAWMPRAYLGFPTEMRYSLWDRCTRMPCGSSSFYSVSFQRALVDDMANNLAYSAPFNGRVEQIVRENYQGLRVVTLHLTGDMGEKAVVRFTDKAVLHKLAKKSRFAAGQVIASEPMQIPEDWLGKSVRVRWEKWLPKLADTNRFDSWMRIWFERQALDLQGDCIHVPAAIASTAAYYHSLEDKLMWDVAPAMPYYNESCDSFIFPTLQIHKWDAFTGVLPGDVAYDLTPSDNRFVPLEEVQRRQELVKILGKTTRKKQRAKDVEVFKAAVNRVGKKPVEKPVDKFFEKLQTTKLNAVNGTAARVAGKKNP